MSKRYEINKITDIIAIPEESFDNFLIDLKAYYQLGKSMPNLIDAITEDEGIRVKTALQKMIWIDDGEHNAKVFLKSAPNKTNGDLVKGAK